MNLWQNEYNAVATMGSNLSDAQAEMLEHFQSVTFVIDPDHAGAGLAKQAIDRLQGHTLLKLVFPPVQADEMTKQDLEKYLGKSIMEE